MILADSCPQDICLVMQPAVSRAHPLATNQPSRAGRVVQLGAGHVVQLGAGRVVQLGAGRMVQMGAGRMVPNLQYFDDDESEKELEM